VDGGIDMLDTIIREFRESPIVWWIDSGTLLGFVREGGFLKHDSDIDIGIIFDDKLITEVESLMERLARLGFRKVRFCWGNHVYKYKLIPHPNGFPYKLDINLFRKSGENYICPQGVKRTNPNGLRRVKQKLIDWKKGNTIAKGSTLRQRIMYWSYLLYARLFLGSSATIQIDRLVPEYYTMYMWVIPREYPENLTLLEPGFPVFAETQEYLEYRYGDWRTAVLDWDFTKDDHGLRRAELSELDVFGSGKESW
jgi:hypothetical protein